jgi:hypothetical protein
MLMISHGVHIGVDRIEGIKWLKGKDTNSEDTSKPRFMDSLAIDIRPFTELERGCSSSILMISDGMHMWVDGIEDVKQLEGKNTNSGDGWKPRFANSLAIDLKSLQDWREDIPVAY